jgi:hypothetical protein
VYAINSVKTNKNWSKPIKTGRFTVSIINEETYFKKWIEGFKPASFDKKWKSLTLQLFVNVGFWWSVLLVPLYFSGHSFILFSFFILIYNIFAIKKIYNL